ncbi:uncharacterized protein LOC103701656 [Phoenix dactylifera]|uniref:Uncharacterized protein LOC103701656 n=1 Tax=Phoenix dactylifera TaxID=42345 RepID=A0A8B7MT14_PHODC|nr:uncharacterized protein LOC103701656 [Phoenix dactylifera]XP_017696955.1 uncharacterized protein LOC103701656 [Phoenix dactylifera]XP_017696956.1 uncharacterized protein LOC103701656 [Phoenix dactylifera]
MGGKPLWIPPALDFSLLNKIKVSPPLRLLPNTSNLVSQPEPQSNPITLPPPPQPSHPNNPLPVLITFFAKSFRSILQSPPAAPPRRPISRSEAGCLVPLFRPYVAKEPWHGGVRAFLSQLFPRYGHYCGPNWSSGKDRGSMLWDRRPIDWLDFCCYCHDIGYDTHDQAKLLKADLTFLECLEKPRMATKGGAHVALLYRAMCIAGLRYVLIPYRMQLLRLKAGPSFVEVVGNLMSKATMPGKIATANHKERL